VLILWWKKRPLLDYLLTIPYWLLGLASGLYTAYLEQAHVGAVGEAWQLSYADKILLAGRAICFYAWKLLFPWDLSFYYTRWQIDPSALWQWIFPLIVIAAMVGLLLARKNIGRGPFVAIAAFFVLLFPALGFFPLFPMLFSWVADHFAYLATVAFIPLICGVLALLAHRLLPGKWELRALLTVPVLLLLGAKTWSVSANYESNGTLFKSVLDYNERHGEPHHWNALSIVSGQLHENAMGFATAGNADLANALNEQAFAFDQESREVYKKMVPGGGDYGALSIQVQLVADVERVLRLPPGAFRPPPKVHSAVVRLRFRPPRVHVGSRDVFERVVRGLFLQRRKTLANALKPVAASFGHSSLDVLQKAGLDGGRRPETLSLEDIARLSQAVL